MREKVESEGTSDNRFEYKTQRRLQYFSHFSTREELETPLISCRFKHVSLIMLLWNHFFHCFFTSVHMRERSSFSIAGFFFTDQGPLTQAGIHVS